MPNSDHIKSSVAGPKFISIGDLKEGFNQVENEEETAKKIAVLVASGTYLPRGLTSGPTNGPGDFQELVFITFALRDESRPRVVGGCAACGPARFPLVSFGISQYRLVSPGINKLSLGSTGFHLFHLVAIDFIVFPSIQDHC